MSRPDRSLLLLFLAIVSLAASWVIVSKFVVPPLIVSVYHGRSSAFLNRIITGQAIHPAEHYLSEWNRISRNLSLIFLLMIFVPGLVVLATRYLALEKVDHFIQECKAPLLCAVLGYLVAAHYWVLGFTTWDGFVYRVPPIVELIQYGSLGGEKFDFFNARYFYPFFELLHYPFLKLFGLPGLFFSFSLVLFPLAVIAIYWFVLELTDDRRWATYSTMTYIGMPFVNEQIFSAYIDFAVLGTLAFFFFALLRALRSDLPSIWVWILFVTATFLFSMSRQHTPYLAVFFVVSIVTWVRGPWNNRAIRTSWSRIFLLGSIFFLGLIPSAILDLGRYWEFGSPIYPIQFKFLGFATAAGIPMDEIVTGSGLELVTWGGMLHTSIRSWLFPNQWLHPFFDSRSMGAGLFFWIALIAFPIIRKRVNRDLGFILLLLIGTALITKDFWLPRYSFSLVLIILICVGGALSRLATQGPRWAYATLLVLSVLHLVGRPITVAAGISLFDQIYPRTNLSDSSWFIQKSGDPVMSPVEIYPDWGADLLIVYPTRYHFVLPLYGKHLSNRIIGKVDPNMLSESCAALRDIAARSQRKVLVVDQTGLLAGKCEWICELPRPWGCMAQRLAPSNPTKVHISAPLRPIIRG